MTARYRQCELTRQLDPRTIQRRVTWALETHAILGRSVRVQEDDGTWSDGWAVTFVSEASLPESAVKTARDAYRRQRRASDL